MFLIAGLNIDIGELCGTNCFLVGTGSERYLIDVCKANHSVFGKHLVALLEEEQCTVKGILVTHSHYDHLDGISEVLSLLQTH